MIVLAQIQAIFIRRYKVYRRSLTNTIITLVLSIVCALVPMIVFLSSKPANSHGGKLINFDNYQRFYNKVVKVINGSSKNPIIKELEDKIFEKAKKEISSGITLKETGTFESYNKYLLDLYDQKLFSDVYFGYHFPDGEPYLGSTKLDGIQSGGNNTFDYDPVNHKLSGQLSFISTENNSFSADPAIITFLSETYRHLTSKVGIDSKLEFHFRSVSGFDATGMINYMLQWMVPLAFVLLHTLFVGEIVNEKSTPVRQFFFANGLKTWTYWVGNFVLDLVIYEIFAFIYFILLIAPGIPFAKKYAGLLIFVFIMNGPGMVCYTYIYSFIFKNRLVASTVLLFANIFILLIPFLLGVLYPGSIMGETVNGILQGLCPVTALRGAINILSSPDTKSLTYEQFMANTDNTANIFGGFISFFLWPVILYFADVISRKAKKDTSKSLWAENAEEFETFKKNFHITEEALDMENQVLSGNQDFAVKIIKAGKVFKKSNGRPFAAVNNASLGIPRGSLFGFLGANGAGKSTMINMIQDQLTLSNGEIYVDGLRVGDKGTGVNPKLLAVCPQFDDFLTQQLTPIEQLRFFGTLQGLSKAELNIRIEDLITKLDLTPHQHKLIGQLSGGNQRKVAIASAFLSQANTILLDEPTTSLDPVARRHVHELIRETKKNTNKTFMLTTHMLDEAEQLCDNISIMLHGCVYAVGTPQYLASKFGKSWNVDMILDDSTIETAARINDWMSEQLPEAKLSLSREYSRIYSIPSTNMKLTDLFRKLIHGQTNRNGIKYFTCSSSTLEKVFLEIVELSEESNTNEFIDDDEDDKPSDRKCRKCCCGRP